MTLWRDIVNIKRHFTELQAATNRDLIKMKGDLNFASRDIVDQTSGLISKQVLSASLQV